MKENIDAAYSKRYVIDTEPGRVWKEVDPLFQKVINWEPKITVEPYVISRKEVPI